MNALPRIMRRALLILASLAIAIVVASLIYVRTNAFGRLVKQQVEELFAANLRGKATLDQIDASAWGILTIHGMALELRDRTVVYAPEIRVGYYLIPLLWGEVRLEVTVIDPKISMERDPDGEWNLMEALASRSPPTAASSASEFAIYIDRLAVRGAAIDVEPEGANGPHYSFEGAEFDAALAVKAGSFAAELKTLTTRVKVLNSPPATLSTALSYSGTSSRAEIKIKAFQLATPASKIAAVGVIRELQTLNSDLMITVDKLAASDLSTLIKNYPLKTDVSGRVYVKGLANNAHAEAQLISGNTHLDANVQGDLTLEKPTFKGELTLTRLDLGKLALPQPVAGMLDLSLRAQGEGLDRHVLAAEAQCQVKALRVGQVNLGSMKLEGGTQHGDVRLDGNLVNGPGRLTFAGTLGDVGSPHYDVVVTSEHFNAAGLSLTALPTDINGRTTISGGGDNLQSIDARASLAISDSAVARLPLKGMMQVRMKAGAIDISEARLLSRGSSATLKGRIGLTHGEASRFSYQVRAEQIAPWLKLLAMTGDGRLSVDGTATGTMRGAQGPMLGAQGTIDIQSAHLSNVRVGTLHAKFNFDRIKQGSWPRGDVTVQAVAVAANRTKLRTVDADAQLHDGTPARLELAIRAHDEKNRVDRLTTNINYQRNRIVGRLDELTLAVQNGTWHLVQRAQFTKDGDHIAIEQFALASGGRQVTLQAAVFLDHTQAIDVQVRAIDLALLAPLFPPGQSIDGTLFGEITISGSATAPLAEANLRVSGLATNSQRLGDVNAAVHYESGRARGELVLYQNRTHQLTLSGDIPIGLQLSHGFSVTIGHSQKVRVYTSGIQLEPFAGVVPKALHNAAGLLQADLAITGSPFDPVINGNLAITGGAGQVVPIGVTVTDIEMRLLASPTSFEIPKFAAQAGDGTLSGMASVALGNNYAPSAMNASLQIHHWPMMATRQYKVTTDGQIQLGGTAQKPHVQGQIDVVDTTIHPDLEFLQGSGVPTPDATIVVIRPGQKALPGNDGTPASTVAASPGPLATTRLFDNLAIDLKANIRRNTWIRDEDAQIELDGKLDISKRAGGPVRLIGEIDTVRGWLQYHGKRFTLASGQVLFTGGAKIDPTLNIDAQNAIADYTIDVIVSGTASKPEIKLQSQPQLAQADILSLILFGTTSNQLGQGQKSALQQQAQSIAVGAAGQALSESLGLASLGVDVNGQSVGFGRYLNQNTYVSVSPNFGASTSSTPSSVASIQYFLWRWLTLTTATMSDGSRQVSLNVNKRY